MGKKGSEADMHCPKRLALGDRIDHLLHKSSMQFKVTHCTGTSTSGGVETVTTACSCPPSIVSGATYLLPSHEHKQTNTSGS
ncbi:hypothetical protein F2Q70_00003893 [Brassica cretica]|uniref:Uncharacterized protein n=1 Tax=Brassica cretica TaxID=69181 RepID=A0A8S9IPU8_BRACR|nr:hypothetical protein F2Q70_00003893 [Brassica cretica]